MCRAADTTGPWRLDQLASITNVQDLQTAIRSSGDKPLLLCFHSPSCEVSRQLLSKLASKSAVPPAQLRVATVSVQGLHQPTFTSTLSAEICVACMHALWSSITIAIRQEQMRQ